MISTDGFEILIEVIDRFWGDVEFANVSGAIAKVLELKGERDSGAGRKSGKLMIIMRVPELSVGVVVEASEDDRATGGAGGCGGVGVGESSAIASEGIEVWRLDDG